MLLILRMLFRRSGDANRALSYLNQACEMVPDGDDTPFLVRSVCFNKLGQYGLADADADRSLKIVPNSVKGLINKAEAQYNMGRFEHAMKYFHR